MSQPHTPPSPYGDHADDSGARTAEADIATPPRGIRQDQSRSGGSGSPGVTPPRRRNRRVRIVTIVALVVGLLGTAWIATDLLRGVWMAAEPRRPVAADAAGVATLAGISVSLVEAVDLGATPSLPGSDWQPPAGYHAWRVVLETSSSNDDILSCDVAIVDDQGRRFEANQFVDSFGEGYEWAYTCGVPGPDDDIGPQQALLVLVPADATPRSVQISEVTLNPDYISLDVP